MTDYLVAGALPAEVASKIRVDTDGCWSWTGSRRPTLSGYGLVRLNRKTRTAHRVVYELLVGPVSVGLELDHLCRNRACVNPAHLEPVTGDENARRGLRGYGLRTLCKSGRHDITDPANIYVCPSTGKRQCRPCKDETRRASRGRLRATTTATKETR